MTGIKRRVSWGLFDQVLSSGSNFALSAVVAATISAAGFGAFTVVYAIYNVAVAFSGGLVSVPLVVRFSAASPDRLRRGTRASAGAALAAGAVAGIACLASASFTISAISGPLLALGVTMPGLLVQDAWRYSFVAAGRPAKAAANDAMWVVLQLVGFALLLITDSASAATMVLVWGGSASVAAILGGWQAGVAPAPRQVPAFLREHRSLAWRYAAEGVVHRSGPWLALSFVGVVAGLRVTGALRGAMLLVGGPLNLLFVGATFAFVSEGVRLVHYSPKRLVRTMRILSITASGIALLWCAVVLSLPDAVGSHLLGATWAQAKPLLPLLSLFVIALAASLGATQGMLALGAAKRSLYTQLAGLGVVIPSMTAGALLAGAKGAAVAMGLTSIFRMVLAWVQFGRARGEHLDHRVPESSERALREATAA